MVLNGATGVGPAPEFAPTVSFNASSHPQSVAVDDVNGDGLRDVAVANLNSHDVSVPVWAIGEAWSGGPAAEATYVLLANAGAVAGQVRVTLVYDDGRTEAQEVAIARHGRATLLLNELFSASDGRRFSVLIESLGGEAAVPIVVDVSRYLSTGGRFGNAGGSTTATRIR